MGADLPPRLKKICRLPIRDIDRLLDIGCGDGGIALLLGNVFRARELYGVDVSAEAVSQAEANGLYAVKADVGKDVLPYGDQFFDIVFAGEVVEHLLNPDNLLGEIHRVLKVSGMCIVTTPNLASWYNRIQLLMGYQPYAIPASHIFRGAGAFWPRARAQMVFGDCYSPSSGIAEGYPYHIQFYTMAGIKALVEAHGFTDVKVTGASYDEAVFMMPGMVRRIVRSVDTAISNTFASLASRTIIVGVKGATK